MRVLSAAAVGRSTKVVAPLRTTTSTDPYNLVVRCLEIEFFTLVTVVTS